MLCPLSCMIPPLPHVFSLFFHQSFFKSLSSTHLPILEQDMTVVAVTGKPWSALLVELRNTLIRVDCCRSTTLFAAFFICRWCSVEHSEKSGLFLLHSKSKDLFTFWLVSACSWLLFHILSLNIPASLFSWEYNYFEAFCFCSKLYFWIVEVSFTCLIVPQAAVACMKEAD